MKSMLPLLFALIAAIGNALFAYAQKRSIGVQNGMAFVGAAAAVDVKQGKGELAGGHGALDAAQHQAADKFKEIAQVISERSSITQEQASSGVKSVISFIAERSRGTREQIVSIAGNVFKPAVACPACGKKAPKGAGFCAFCGKPLGF